MGSFQPKHDRPEPILAYRLRWKRRRLLFRSWRKRRALRLAVDRTRDIQSGGILAFGCFRNEEGRLPFFLDHYRRLGVTHFLCVVNDSTDNTRAILEAAPDCSVWETDASYKASRFGMDWIGYLQMQYGHGHWCLTVDADELLVYPGSDHRDLRALTSWLDQTRQRAFAAPLLDLYPEGALGDVHYAPGQAPWEVLTHYDAWNTTHIWQPKQRNQWIQGGPRARIFFAAEPKRAPTLNKIPLVKWDRRYSYVTSTHILLPRHLNQAFDATPGLPVIGALLHTKFLDSIVEKSAEERVRGEHFQNSTLYDAYYEALTKNPTLWHSGAKLYRGLDGLAEDGVFWGLDWG